MNASRLALFVLVMSGVTYLIRMLPLAIFHKEIKSKFLKSFLYYVPYAVLAAMAFPAILGSTASIYSALAGLTVAAVLAYFEKGLLTVAAAACGTVWITELLLTRLS